MKNCRMSASKQRQKGNYLRKPWRITGKPWISFAAYRAISGNAHHDRYQIEEISHNAYHCKYEIGRILPEPVSLYTFKWEFSRSLHALYAHIAGKQDFIVISLILLDKRSEKVAIWMASIAKMYIFTAFGCARTPYAAVGRKKEQR